LASKAIVLINTDLGAEKEVIGQLRRIEGVTEVYLVYGGYDIVVVLEAENLVKIKEIITYNIRRMDKVRTTLSMLAVENS